MAELHFGCYCPHQGVKRLLLQAGRLQSETGLATELAPEWCFAVPSLLERASSLPSGQPAMRLRSSHPCSPTPLGPSQCQLPWAHHPLHWSQAQDLPPPFPGPQRLPAGPKQHQDVSVGSLKRLQLTVDLHVHEANDPCSRDTYDVVLAEQARSESMLRKFHIKW